MFVIEGFAQQVPTLYVCDEGDGVLVPGQVVNGQPNVASAYALQFAGVQKYVLENVTWVLAYVLQNGLDIGVPYSVPNYPAALNPVTGGCRNMTGQVGPAGTVNIGYGRDPNVRTPALDRLASESVNFENAVSGHPVCCPTAPA